MHLLAVLITLIFTPPAGTITGYRVDLGKTSGATDLTVPTTAAGGKITIDVDTAIYKFLRLRAVNGVSVGSPSAEVNLVFPAAPLTSSVQAD